ncbi:inactive serine/threonine-protein kinase PLK5 isoform X2 [Taeniopygia guttata]|uniref:inactive serine/threonine-protein kinase PLK5 isoform X2 n=1 Tax=Taeniopygia guttata TaxID=59729 RepID=UPI003BB958E1
MVPGSAGAEPTPGWYLRDEGSGTLYKRGRLLGEGTFGRCYQVTEVTSGRLYAAKVIPRARLAAAGTGDRVSPGGHSPGRGDSARGSPQSPSVPLPACLGGFPSPRGVCWGGSPVPEGPAGAAGLLSVQVERELELQRRLRHRHIVRLHGHFTDRGHLCLLLELCSRGSLAGVLRARGRLTEPEVRFYLRQLLSGLRYLHGHGLVHRDLKLSNFLLTERMRVKIADLGLARRAAPPGRRWGYTALTGHAPFEARHRQELYRRIRSARYPLPPQLSPGARALIALMLHPDPAARPSPAGLLGHPFLTQGFTPRTLPPRACHSVPIFVGQEPLCRILRGLRCCGCVPAPPQST